MKYGFVLPFADARAAADSAREAERAGWDGLFVWEPVWGIDAWMSLAAAAMVTERIRLGTMLTPLSRMRPWKLAGEALTLDHLSGGRAVLAVGLGALDSGFAAFGEVTDRKVRAELLDEGLDIVTGLWKGQPFCYAGKHYTVRETTFFVPAPPVQRPRIPIWVVGAVESKRSMARALKYDGLLPTAFDTDAFGTRSARQANQDEVRAVSAKIKALQMPDHLYDIIIDGETPGDDAARGAEKVRAWEEAGATWWLESRWTAPEPSSVAERIRQGPPRSG